MVDTKDLWKRDWSWTAHVTKSPVKKNASRVETHMKNEFWECTSWQGWRSEDIECQGWKMRTSPTFLSPMEMANTKVGAAETLLLSFHSWDVLLSPSFQSLFSFRVRSRTSIAFSLFKGTDPIPKVFVRASHCSWRSRDRDTAKFRRKKWMACPF